MNEIRDAKFFGARIGDKCWYRDEECINQSVSVYKDYFDVFILNSNTEIMYVKNGEGITFEPPKKKVKKEIDCLVSTNNIPVQGVAGQALVYVVQLTPEIIRDTLIPAKLTFEIEE